MKHAPLFVWLPLLAASLVTALAKPNVYLFSSMISIKNLLVPTVAPPSAHRMSTASQWVARASEVLRAVALHAHACATDDQYLQYQDLHQCWKRGP